MTAQLIGMGVGPGDKDLISLTAYKILQNATVIAYIAPPEKPSLARSIVAEHLPSTLVCEIVLTVPMRTDTTTATAVYDKGATQILQAIQSGQSVIFLCEGDPMFYGSFIYIYKRLYKTVTTQIIPGINAISAGCSVAQIAFSSRSDICCILPATLPEKTLIQYIQTANSIAIIKIGRHLNKVKSALIATHTLDKAICVIEATMGSQQITPVQNINEVPYFSIIFITQNRIKQ